MAVQHGLEPLPWIIYHEGRVRKVCYDAENLPVTKVCYTLLIVAGPHTTHYDRFTHAGLLFSLFHGRPHIEAFGVLFNYMSPFVRSPVHELVSMPLKEDRAAVRLPVEKPGLVCRYCPCHGGQEDRYCYNYKSFHGNQYLRTIISPPAEERTITAPSIYFTFS